MAVVRSVMAWADRRMSDRQVFPCMTLASLGAATLTACTPARRLRDKDDSVTTAPDHPDCPCADASLIE